MKISTSVVDIEKGDTLTLVEYNEKTYIHTSTHAPFTSDSPATFFADNGSGTLVDGDENPIEDFSVVRAHLSSLVIDNKDVIYKTDGKIFNAIYELEVAE